MKHFRLQTLQNRVETFLIGDVADIYSLIIACPKVALMYRLPYHAYLYRQTDIHDKEWDVVSHNCFNKQIKSIIKFSYYEL